MFQVLSRRSSVPPPTCSTNSPGAFHTSTRPTTSPSIPAAGSVVSQVVKNIMSGAGMMSTPLAIDSLGMPSFGAGARNGSYKPTVATFRDPNRVLQTCSYCQRTYASKSGLRHHISRNHATEAFLRCDFCSKLFEDEKRLTAHMSSDCESLMLKKYF